MAKLVYTQPTSNKQIEHAKIKRKKHYYKASIALNIILVLYVIIRSIYD